MRHLFGWKTTVKNKTLPSYSEFTIFHHPFKRIFDLLFSAMALVLLFPLFCCIALTIFLTTRGKIIYFHERIGRGGKPFKCYKFCTMYCGADKKLEQLLEEKPELKKEWEKNFKLKQDPRITPIGAFLRKTSLDELPQFWNVFKGDLSIVGPRPVVQGEVLHYFGNKAKKILSIRPGITGLWQVYGRSDISYRARIFLDEKYVDNHSLLLDLKLICKTLVLIFSPKGAY